MPPSAVREPSVLASILQSIAPGIGAQVVLDPTWQYAGQITFSSGRRAYFRGTSLDINPHGSSEIAKDKDYAAYFMRRMGFPVVDGETFFSDSWAAEIGSDRNAHAALLRADEIGYPLVVKPNSSSQGRAVHLVADRDEFRKALTACFALDRVILLQRFIPARDYRVVVMGDEVISAYERVPLGVVGDGVTPISDLIIRHVAAGRSRGRSMKVFAEDDRISACLRAQGYDRSSVPVVGERVRLLPIANLTTGAEAIDVTGRIQASLVELCVNVTREMGLRLCGVDLLVEGDACGNVETVHILEVNSSPGLDNYASIGETQLERVRMLYKRVLAYMDAQPGR